MNDVILSRIAEALTWTGRYVERADATGRILDAYLHRLLEDPWRDEDAACRSLYAILGVDAPDQHCDMQQVLDRLAFDAGGIEAPGAHRVRHGLVEDAARGLEHAHRADRAGGLHHHVHQHRSLQAQTRGRVGITRGLAADAPRRREDLAHVHRLRFGRGGRHQRDRRACARGSSTTTTAAPVT